MATYNIPMQMQQRCDTVSNWESYNPILLTGQIGIALDDETSEVVLYKIGDGTTTWNNLTKRVDFTPEEKVALKKFIDAGGTGGGGTSNVNISTDINNAIIKGTDGGLYTKGYDSKIAELETRSVYGSSLACTNIKLSSNFSMSTSNSIVPFNIIDNESDFIKLNNDGSVSLSVGHKYLLMPAVFIGATSGWNNMRIVRKFDNYILQKFQILSVNLADTGSGVPVMPFVYSVNAESDSVIYISNENASSGQVINSTYTNFAIIEIGRSYIEDQAKRMNNNLGIEDAPVGHVISYMGNTAPKHYLICDGSIYNIADYKDLTTWIIKEHGLVNVWGGDGITTFAVPDMRGEFVRGADKTALRDPDGATRGIGKHQDATIENSIQSLPTSAGVQVVTNGNSFTKTSNYDKQILGNTYVNIYKSQSGAQSSMSTYTARPTNVNTLFCIKYEPTYYMYTDKLVYGGFKKDVIFEGKANIINSTYSLSKSFNDYTEIKAEITALDSTGAEIILSDISIRKQLNAVQVFGYGSVSTSVTLYIIFKSDSSFIVSYKSLYVWKDIYINKIYGLKTDEDFVTSSEVEETIQEITGGDKSWLE